MPQIPLTQVPRVAPAGPTGPAMLDPNAAAAPFRALEEVGHAIGNVADVAQGFAVKRQRLYDAGNIAEADQKNRETESRIEALIGDKLDPMTGKPLPGPDYRQWQTIARKEWERRAGEINFEDSNLSEEAKLKMRSDLQAVRDRSMVSIRNQAIDRGIQENNAQLKAAALERARNGDREGAIAYIGDMNINPERKQSMIDEVISAGAYDEALQFLDDANTDEDLTAFMSELGEKKDGNYVNYDGLSYQGRKRVESMARNKLARMQQERITSIRRGISSVLRGDSTAFDLEDEMRASGADERTIEAQTKILQSAAAAEETTEEFETLKDAIDFRASGWFSGDRAPEKYGKILQDIAGSKLSKESKLNLYNRWLDMYSLDLAEGQVETVSPGFWSGGQEITLDDEDKVTWALTMQALKDVSRQTRAPIESQGQLMLDLLQDFAARKNSKEPIDQGSIRQEYLSRVVGLQISATMRAAMPTQAPQIEVGTEQDGYRFKGGDPANPESWEPIE